MSTLVRSFLDLAPEDLAVAGGKGASLARLAEARYPVPAGFVILPAAFSGDDLGAEAWAEVQARLAGLRAGAPDGAFAVRSSALSEDSTSASFAGEFETVLNVRSDDEIRQAILTVRASRHGERVAAYSRGRGMETEHEIAVVVQELVCAEAAGVLFTADPITGRRDRAVLTATWGLGEAIVGGLVTPDILTVDKATGRTLARQIADKAVMTVRLRSGTAEQPAPEPLRRAPVLSEEQAAELVRLGAQIEALYGMPMDIEWALAGDRFAILQARPITALPPAKPVSPAEPVPGAVTVPEAEQPEPAPPAAWKLPKGSYAAMRNNIVELMAGPLTPLFGTWGRAAINASLNRLLEGFFGRSGIMPDEIIISVNGYAYFDGSLSAGQMLRLLGGSVGTAKRMFRGAVERWTEAGRPRYLAAVERRQAGNRRALPATELLGAAREMMEAAIDAYGALVSGVIPAAWISEALFTGLYNRLLRRRGDPPAATYLLGFDSAPILAEKALYDLAQWVRTRPGLAAYLAATPGPQLAARLGDDGVPAGVEECDWLEWQARFRGYLASYGHTIYSLDFANPVPADEPTPLLETCRLFVSGQGTDPYARQRAAEANRERATAAVLGRLKGRRARLFREQLARAQRYAPLREDGLADVGRAYPLLRQMLLELGRRFAEGGMIANPNDIFWLTGSEVEEAAARLDRSMTLDSQSAAIPGRKAAWRAARRVTPPTRLPYVKLPGLPAARAIVARRRGRGMDLLVKGVAASPGRVTGLARVLNGPEDFTQMQAGEVLVAAITTPAWTPLFARAAAVVTDVGGPLSHGSIVAREYGIPAVLGTGQATKRIHSGQLITVDGSAGLVTLSQDRRP